MVVAVNETGVLAVAILFPLLDTAAVAARFYVRRWKKIQLGVDDWSVFAALVCTNIEQPMHWTSCILTLAASI